MKAKKRPAEIPQARWDAIFTPPRASEQHGPATGCNCEPGDCKALTTKACRDWMKRGGK